MSIRSLSRRSVLAWILAAICLAPAVAHAQDQAAGKTIRLLTIGNSFSQNATTFLAEIVKADGQTLIHHRCVIGGSGFAQHWDKVEKHQQDAQDKAGRYNTGKSLVDELKAEPWDFITIQQASIRSHNIETYRPTAKQLCDFIRQHAPKSEVVLHETWAYRMDDPRFKPGDKAEGEPKTRQEMYEGLRQAYATAGKELGVRQIPVGDAFHLADSDSQWGYKPDLQFDFKTAQPKALPDQTHSLHVGYYWGKDKAGKPSINIDGHHASVRGQYLGGCVFYEFLFGRSVVGNSFAPPGLPPEDVKFLQEIAHRAVSGQQP